METVDLESEYSPSRWSLRFNTPAEVLQNHKDFVKQASEIATTIIPNNLAIDYGSTPGQKLDIMGTDLPDEAPIFVYIHGGCWQILSREISRYTSLGMYQSNVKTIVVGYDLCPVVTLPEIINQIENAARFVLEYAEKMGSRGVYFAGHSAGGHLVARLLTNAALLDSAVGANRLRGAFLISGLFDIQELIKTTIYKALQLSKEQAFSLSPQFDSFAHVNSRQLRVFIIAGEYDSPTFKKQSREFYRHLEKEGLEENVYLEIKEKMDHFNIVECFAEPNNYLVNLLMQDMQFFE